MYSTAYADAQTRAFDSLGVVTAELQERQNGVRFRRWFGEPRNERDVSGSEQKVRQRSIRVLKH